MGASQCHLKWGWGNSVRPLVVLSEHLPAYLVLRHEGHVPSHLTPTAALKGGTSAPFDGAIKARVTRGLTHSYTGRQQQRLTQAVP